MSKIVEFFKSPHILIALATGINIIILAYFSKRMLPEEISFLSSSFPPFIMVIYESLLQKYEKHQLMNVWYWIVLIFLSTAIIILLNL